MTDRGLASFLARINLQRRLAAGLDHRGYLPVVTPLLSPGAPPDPDLDPMTVAYMPKMETGPGPTAMFLATSPEFALKRLLVRGLEAVSQIGPVFRQGELGPLHGPEFTMAEWYRTGWTYLELMTELEGLIYELLGPSVRVNDREINLRPPLARVPVRAALAAAGVDCREWDNLDPAAWRERWDRAFVDRLEPWLAGRGAVFLMDFPAPLALLARLKDDQPDLAERFELIVGGIELANGATELTDPAEHRTRFARDLETRKQSQRPLYPLPEDFLEDLEAIGLPPCAGVALGVDRLAMIGAGVARIQPVQAFPFLK